MISGGTYVCNTQNVSKLQEQGGGILIIHVPMGSPIKLDVDLLTEDATFSASWLHSVPLLGSSFACFHAIHFSLHRLLNISLSHCRCFDLFETRQNETKTLMETEIDQGIKILTVNSFSVPGLNSSLRSLEYFHWSIELDRLILLLNSFQLYRRNNLLFKGPSGFDICQADIKKNAFIQMG